MWHCNDAFKIRSAVEDVSGAVDAASAVVAPSTVSLLVTMTRVSSVAVSGIVVCVVVSIIEEGKPRWMDETLDETLGCTEREDPR